LIARRRHLHPLLHFASAVCLCISRLHFAFAFWIRTSHFKFRVSHSQLASRRSLIRHFVTDQETLPS
jgi:hypothetical protein